jgi:hypothetical protein
MPYSDNDYDMNHYEKTEGTDMQVDMLANSEKLHPRDERYNYTKHNNHDNHDTYDDEMDENMDSYKKDTNNYSHSRTENYHSENNDSHDSRDRNDRNDRTDRDDRTEDKSNDKYIDDEYEGLSPLEKRLRRLDFMRKLGELRDLGCKVTNYSIDDDYYMMKYEYELHTSIRTKRNWMGLYNHMLVGGVKLMELANDRYNPFDFKLGGLSNEVSADKNTYYEILGEIYEHYNVPGKKMNPWMRLAINLIGTVTIVGGKNNAHKFLPKQAAAVENDQSMLEGLRAKAMNSTQNAQQQPDTQRNNLDEFMNKEHDKAAQRVKDLEDLKRQELEFQQFQKMLAEDNNKFTNIKKQLEMSQQSPGSVISSRHTASASAQRSAQRSASSQRSAKKESSSESDSRSTLSNQTTETSDTSRSSVSVNKKLAAQLKAGRTSPIKPSQISFGSSIKGKKSAFSIGK